MATLLIICLFSVLSFKFFNPMFLLNFLITRRRKIGKMELGSFIYFLHVFALEMLETIMMVQNRRGLRKNLLLLMNC